MKKPVLKAEAGFFFLEDTHAGITDSMPSQQFLMDVGLFGYAGGKRFKTEVSKRSKPGVK
ncbi:MAG: hypothetical protein HYR77_10245 [Ignavibacteria bacterium]|nr:hypothetical protein [Ignavibacteria bacterium]